MGNSSSGLSRCTLKSEADTEPNDALVDQVFVAMNDAFDRTTREMDAVERELLLSKLCSKFQEEYPSVMKAARMDGALVTSPARKKRKLSNDTKIIQKWAIPLELLLIVARYLPRASLNKLKLACKRVHRAIENPELLTQPWGAKCPFHFPPPGENHGSIGGVIFSSDGSRVAVFTMGTYDDDDKVDVDADDYNADEVPGTLQVWDRRMGLLGEVECAPGIRMWFKPVSSPDNQLLLLPPRNMDDGDGIRVCNLPSRELLVPIVVSSHELNGALVRSVAFLDNTTIAFMDRNANGIKTCNVTRDNDQITLTEAVQTTLVDPDHSGAWGHGLWAGRLASFSGASKDIMAFVYDITDRSIILHDRRTNKSVARPIPAKSDGVLDVAFSLDGNRLVVAHLHGGLSVFDCNGDSIDEIGEPRAIILVDNSSYHYRNISFSLRSASKISVACQGDVPDVAWIRIIDIENDQILSDGWNGSSWKTLVS